MYVFVKGQINNYLQLNACSKRCVLNTKTATYIILIHMDGVFPLLLIFESQYHAKSYEAYFRLH